MRLLPVLAVVTLLAGTARAEPTAEEHFQQGEMYMQAGVYDKAVQEYEASYKLAPTAHLLVFNVGLAYDKWGKRKPALEQLKSYLEKDPQGAKAAEAKARITRLEREIGELEAATTAASNAEAAGDHERAAIAYLSAYRIEPEMHGYLFQAAIAHAAAGKKAEAVQELDRYITADPRGEHIDDARSRKSVLEQELARDQAERERLQKQAVVDTARAEAKKEAESGVNWWQIGLGAAALGLGVILDVGPPTASNDKFDATDLLPVGLYGAGGTLVFFGVF